MRFNAEDLHPRVPRSAVKAGLALGRSLPVRLSTQAKRAFRICGLRPFALRLTVAAFAVSLCATASGAPVQGNAAHGKYLAEIGDCVACHTAKHKGAVPFAGGRALKSPFGTFYGPNITPDPGAGIGRWSEQDFVRAMRYGERPDGTNLFPAFPYTSFTRVTDHDLRDLWAYLRTIPPSSRPDQPHKLRFPYNLRALVSAWKILFFKPGPFKDNPARSPVVNRGAYLVQGLGHCGECHTPRNFLGASENDRYLAGTKGGPDGWVSAPNLTPSNLKNWSDNDLKNFLQTGFKPDGDYADEPMSEVINKSTSHLTPSDLAAVIAYLRSLPPLPSESK